MRIHVWINLWILMNWTLLLVKRDNSLFSFQVTEVLKIKLTWMYGETETPKNMAGEYDKQWQGRFFELYIWPYGKRIRWNLWLIIRTLSDCVVHFELIEITILSCGSSGKLSSLKHPYQFINLNSKIKLYLI